MKRLIFQLGSIAFLLLAPLQNARAGVSIVPESRGAAQLSPRTLAIKTEISGRFARTWALWTFSNTSKIPFEAEFVADAPREAVVTGFAYYFRGERVVARVVEKQRAAEIYRGITAQRRDPALVEMIARNLFRARISPVAPGEDVRIETTWVQPLLRENGAWTYEIPLRDKGESWTLKSWSFEAKTLNLPHADVESNFALMPRSSESSSNGIFQSAPDAKLPDTLKFTLRDSLSSVPVRSNSGAADYFALRAAPDETVSLPAGATQIWRNSTKNEVLIVGRAPHARNGNVFADVAEKLWAAAQIDALARDDKNQKTVMALSRRFGLPSKWTSWLAIPTAERARLKPIIEREKRAQAERNLRALGLAMAQEIGAGRASQSAYRKMRAQFDANSRIVDADPKTRFASAIDEQLAYYAEQIRYSNYGNDGKVSQGKAVSRANNLFLRVKRMRPFGSERGRDWSSQAETSLARLQLDYVAPDWAKSRIAGLEDRAKRAQIGRIFQRVAPYVEDWNGEFSSPILGPLALRWAQLKSAPKVDPSKVKRARAEVESAAMLFPTDAKKRREMVEDMLRQQEGSQFYARIEGLKKALAAEVVAKRENGEKAKQIRAEFAEIGTRLEFESPDFADAKSLPVDKALEKVAGDLQRAELSETPDATQIAVLGSELKRLEGFAAPYTVKQSERSGRWETLLKLRREIAGDWVQAAQRDGDSARAAQIKTRLQTVLDTQTAKIHDNDAGYRWKADNELRAAESDALAIRSHSLRESLVEEQSRLRSNPQKIKEIRVQLDAMQARTIYNQNQISEWLKYSQGDSLDAILKNLRAENAKPAPDAELIADLERRAIELSPFDHYAQGWQGWRGARHDADPKEFGTLRVARIKARAQREKAQQRLAKAPANLEIRAEVAQWLQQENQLRVRMGDPLIAVRAPRNARSVVAIFPNGELKKLSWNAQTSQWEARFDVPTWAKQGDYAVQIVVVFASGTRQKLTMHFAIDLQNPVGAGRVQNAGKIWHLRLETGAQTDRVVALMPWNARLELRRGADGIFAADASVPAEFESSMNSSQSAVRFVLTDKAHNRTEVWVDWK